MTGSPGRDSPAAQGEISMGGRRCYARPYHV